MQYKAGEDEMKKPEYTLTMCSETAREINKAVELLMRWKLKQDDIVTSMVLDFADKEYCDKRDKIKPLMKMAMETAMPEPPVGFAKLKDDEWYLLYNVYQSIRYAIHEAEHPDSTGVDSYPPIPTGGQPIPKCEWRMKDD